jgi:hypothetical protein
MCCRVSLLTAQHFFYCLRKQEYGEMADQLLYRL